MNITPFYMNRKITIIVVDGGPCGGKTEWLVYVLAILVKMGYVVRVVEEAATILINESPEGTDYSTAEFQQKVVKLQLELEEQAMQELLNHEAGDDAQYLLICDRGLMTGMAYLHTENSLETYEREVLESYGFTAESALGRYHGVVYFYTAVDGAPEFYNRKNAARKETPEQALARCMRNRGVWVGHREVVHIPNRRPDNSSITFPEKKELGLNHLLRMIGATNSL